MKKLIYLLIFANNILFAHDITINFSPDTCFVGSVCTLTVKVANIEMSNIFPVFNNVIEESRDFTLINTELNESSNQYILQFWEEGHIVLAPIHIDIKKNNQIIDEILTDSIYLTINSNLIDKFQKIKDIKPLKEINFISKRKLSFILFILIVAISCSLYLWKKKRKTPKAGDNEYTYEKSALSVCIKNIESVTIPEKINVGTTESFYLEVTNICRKYLNKLFYVRATEMTSTEIETYFLKNNIDNNLLIKWRRITNSVNIAKYGGQISNLNQFKENKLEFIKLMKAFHGMKEKEKAIRKEN